MIKLYVGAATPPATMDKIWRFRHAQFVERLGWQALYKQDGRETDPFDHDRALHLVLYKQKTVVGYSRLLPTIEPHLLSTIYPQIMKGGTWPRAPDIFEWTRCAADTDYCINAIPASHILMTGVMEFCLVAGIAALIVETHPKLVKLLMSTGWEITPLGLPAQLDGAPLVPIQAKPSLAGLKQHHRHYGLEGSTLALDPDQINPLQPPLPLKPLTGLACGKIRRVWPAHTQENR